MNSHHSGQATGHRGTRGWSLSWLEEELKLEKNMQVSTALPALGLGDKVKEQADKLETLAFM